MGRSPARGLTPASQFVAWFPDSLSRAVCAYFFLDLRAGGVSLRTMVDALPRLGMWDSAISAERYFWFLAPSR